MNRYLRDTEGHTLKYLLWPTAGKKPWLPPLGEPMGKIFVEITIVAEGNSVSLGGVVEIRI